MFNKTPKRGIKVTVDTKEYNVNFSTPPTLREIRLAALLKSQGGVSDSVAPGEYEFNAQRRGLFNIWVSLDPWKN